MSIINIDYRSSNYLEKTLSNLAPHAFCFDGILCNSMEGFLQSLKFSDSSIQPHICSLYGFTAKKRGSKQDWKSSQTLWWKEVPFERHSEQYQQLLDLAYNTLFEQNNCAKKALLQTYPHKLIHTVGSSNKKQTILTEKEFCSKLTKIREEIYSEQFLEF